MQNMTTWLTWWNNGDFLVRGVFLLLLAFSLTGWGIIIHKQFKFDRLLRKERRIRVAMEQALRQGNSLPAEVGILGEIAALVTLRKVSASHRNATWEANLAHALREKRVELESGLTLLASIASSSPFIGLFGTVWGIMHALEGLGHKSLLTMDVVAGPVAEALVATALGLLVAIPAVIGYNLLVRRLRRLLTTAEGNLLRSIHQIELFCLS
ncbi:MAG: MotA/TolQ/ExbB proton channel family protein [Magnetococcus sp. DMHC-1]